MTTIEELNAAAHYGSSDRALCGAESWVAVTTDDPTKFRAVPTAWSWSRRTWATALCTRAGASIAASRSPPLVASPGAGLCAAPVRTVGGPNGDCDGMSALHRGFLPPRRGGRQRAGVCELRASLAGDSEPLLRLRRAVRRTILRRLWRPGRTVRLGHRGHVRSPAATARGQGGGMRMAAGRCEPHLWAVPRIGDDFLTCEVCGQRLELLHGIPGPGHSWWL